MHTVYAWGGKPNFGDAMSPLIINSFVPDWVVETEDLTTATISAQGSILGFFDAQTMTQHLHVWGSGFLRPHLPLTYRHVSFYAVRGQLTRIIQGLPTALPLGDPGLLVERIVPQAERGGRIGIAPHHSHVDDPQWQALLAHPDTLFIDVAQPPLDVIRDISTCSCVLASSLHGLVVADAYGIPNQWVEPVIEKIESTFKFFDYYSAFDRVPQHARIASLPPTPECLHQFVTTVVDGYERGGLQRIQQGLIESFGQMHQALGQ